MQAARVGWGCCSSAGSRAPASVMRVPHSQAAVAAFPSFPSSNSAAGSRFINRLHNDYNGNHPTSSSRHRRQRRHLSLSPPLSTMNPAWIKRQKATTPPPPPTPAEVLRTLPPFTLGAETQTRPEARAVMAALDSKVIGHHEIKEALVLVRSYKKHTMF